ncbi:MAG: hypothetical protein WC055_02130 [Melioribacteraceae bacterium]
MIKLSLVILSLVLYVSNFFICNAKYPGASSDWNIFIPMDTLHHGIWAVIILILFIAMALKTIIDVTDFFIYTGILYCIVDVLARFSLMPFYSENLYKITLISCPLIASLVYAYRKRK